MNSVYITQSMEDDEDLFQDAIEVFQTNSFVQNTLKKADTKNISFIEEKKGE